ncbi:MAG: hypothetical protein PF692_13185 [Kiritimatiellae bacterium]|jgi:hypothetical protein|nr:hypothetical protein [Kiritimatiellia bacterium]
MNYKTTIISALLGALATLHLAAEDNNLRATLGVNGQGRTVEIKVNGSKITNIKGGGAEAVQLYHKNHPWGDDFSDALKHLLCLKEGENSIDVTYSQKDGDEVENLEVYIIASGYSKPLLSGTKKKDEVEGKMSGKFVLHSKEPDDFKTEKLK